MGGACYLEPQRQGHRVHTLTASSGLSEFPARGGVQALVAREHGVLFRFFLGSAERASLAPEYEAVWPDQACGKPLQFCNFVAIPSFRS